MRYVEVDIRRQTRQNTLEQHCTKMPKRRRALALGTDRQAWVINFYVGDTTQIKINLEFSEADVGATSYHYDTMSNKSFGHYRTRYLQLYISASTIHLYVACPFCPSFGIL